MALGALASGVHWPRALGNVNLQNLDDRSEDQNGTQRNCKCQCLQGQSITKICDCVDPADKAAGEQEEAFMVGR